MNIRIKKISRGLVGMAIVLLGVTFLSFSLMYLAPGDPAEAILRLGGNMPTQADIAAKRIELGLDKPFLEQYWNWLINCLHGDFGMSMVSGTDISKELFEALCNSALLSIFSLLIGVGIAFPIGIYAAVHKNGWLDQTICNFVFLRMSSPAFLVGLLFLYIFAYYFRLLPITSSGSVGISSLALPVATLATGICAKMIRQVRTIIGDEMKAPYVDGLRSRGIDENIILFRHVLKNSMLPIITQIALFFGELLGGTAITETVFSFPGIGLLVLSAIHEKDYPIVQAFVVLIAVIFCIVYELTDVSYKVFDPRVGKARE